MNSISKTLQGLALVATMLVVGLPGAAQAGNGSNFNGKFNKFDHQHQHKFHHKKFHKPGFGGFGLHFGNFHQHQSNFRHFDFHHHKHFHFKHQDQKFHNNHSR